MRFPHVWYRLFFLSAHPRAHHFHCALLTFNPIIHQSRILGSEICNSVCTGHEELRRLGKGPEHGEFNEQSERGQVRRAGMSGCAESTKSPSQTIVNGRPFQTCRNELRLQIRGRDDLRGVLYWSKRAALIYESIGFNCRARVG